MTAGTSQNSVILPIMNLYKDDLVEFYLCDLTKNVHHSRRFKVSIPLREECESGTPFDPEDIVIYTDGTKMEASSGAGILFGTSPNE